MDMVIGIVLANSLWFIPVALLVVVLIKAATNGYKKYRVIERSNEMVTCAMVTDCPADHVCIKGRCIPESKLEELISSIT